MFVNLGTSRIKRQTIIITHLSMPSGDEVLRVGNVNFLLTASVEQKVVRNN